MSQVYKALSVLRICRTINPSTSPLCLLPRHLTTSTSQPPTPPSDPEPTLPDLVRLAHEIIDRRLEIQKDEAEKQALKAKRAAKALRKRRKSSNSSLAVREPAARKSALSPATSDRSPVKPPSTRHYTTTSIRSRSAYNQPKPSPIQYYKESNPLSYETKAFLAAAPSTGSETGGGDGSLETFETLGDEEVKRLSLGEIAGMVLERGMIVECRRSGFDFLGIILTTLVGSGKVRYLMLRSNGETIPSSAQDIQYILPSHLIPKHLIAQISDRALGMEITGVLDEQGEREMDANKAVKRSLGRELRKVELELDKRKRQLGSEGRLDVRRIWEEFSAQSEIDNSGEKDVTKHIWSTSILEEISRFALGSIGKKPISYLDSLIIHQTLMNRPDLFQADESSMAVTQRFSLRPRSQVDVLRAVEGWVQDWEDGLSDDGNAREVLEEGKGKEMKSFVRQAKEIIERRREKVETRHREEGSNLPIKEEDRSDSNPLSNTSRLILSILEMRLAERRTTQTSPYAALSSAILKSIGLYGSDKMDVSILIKCLQELGEIKEWDSMAGRRLKEASERDGYSFAIKVDSASLKETDSRPDEHRNLRRDFQDTPIYVIDDASAQELDDGISLEGTSSPDIYWVHVHIADPTRWLRPGDPLSVAAEQRGATLYVPEATQAMLPHGSTMSRMSLGAKSEDGQPVLTFSVKVDLRGKLLDHDVGVSLVRNVKRMTYEDAGVAMADLSGSDAQGTDLHQLGQLSVALRLKRLEKGLEWQIPKGSVSVGRTGSSLLSPTSIITGLPPLSYHAPPIVTSKPSAETMVAEFMIAANRVSAAFCSERGLAAPFRGSSTPFIPERTLGADRTTEDAIEQLRMSRDPISQKVDYIDVAKLGLYMGKAPMTGAPLDHFMLGIDAREGGYLRSTSPLRRYSDMLVHWQIKHWLLEGKARFDGDYVIRKAFALDRAESRIARLERASQDFWRTVYLARAVASGELVNGDINLQDLEAVVLSDPQYQTSPRVTDTGVLLPAIGVQAVLSYPGRQVERHHTIGDRIRVRVEKVETWPAAYVLVKSLGN